MFAIGHWFRNDVDTLAARPVSLPLRALLRASRHPARRERRNAGDHAEAGEIDALISVDVIRMRAGDTVWTPPGEEHWHGGTSSTVMCHIAMLEGTNDGDGTTWLEPVDDEQYAAAHTD